MARPKKVKIDDTANDTSTVTQVADTRKERLLAVMKDINKTFGEKVVKLGSEEKPKEYLSFGVPEIDSFSGGLTRGNFSVIYGAESTGKSTLALHTIADAQKKGLLCCYIDLEHSFSPSRASQLGVNLDELLLITEAENAEQAMDATIKLSKERVVDLIIIDSVQAMSSVQEQETKTGKELSVYNDTMALLARKLGQFFRMCATPVYKGQVAVLMIGQVRTMGIGSFITRDGLSGGKALHHWAYQIVYIRRGQSADAPTRKEKEAYIDEETGQEKTRTVKIPIGFDAVLKLEKSKSSMSKGEGSDMHIPFYRESGFLAPVTPVVTEEIKNDVS